MEEHRQRSTGAGIEQIDHLAYCRAVIHPLDLQAGQAGSIGFGIRGPTSKNLRMLGHPGPIVVFLFVIDLDHRPVPLRAAQCRARQLTSILPLLRVLLIAVSSWHLAQEVCHPGSRIAGRDWICKGRPLLAPRWRWTTD